MAVLAVLGGEGGNNTYGLVSSGTQVTINSTSPKTGSYDYACDMDTNADNGQFKVACTAPSGGGSKRWVYFHFKVTALPSAEMILHVGNDDATYGNKVVINTDGTLEVYLSGGSKATSTNTISADTWYWCKVEWYFPGTGFTGYCNVDIDGVEWVSGTLANISQSAFTGLIFGDVCPAGSNFGTTLRIDDIFCNDTASGGTTTEITSEIYVLGARPTGEGDYEQAGWTGVSDNTDKYKNWDEAPYNGTGTTDSDYNTTATTDIKLTSAMPTAATIGIPSGATIPVVCLRGWGRRSDAGKEHHGPLLRVSNTDQGAVQSAWSNTSYAESIFGTVANGYIRVGPPTGGSWATSSFDDWELGWQTITVSEAHSATILVSAVWAEIAYYTTPAGATGTETGRKKSMSFVHYNNPAIA